MRAINVLLSILISLVIALLVIEVGMRVILPGGGGSSINEFDETLGWRKKPGSTGRRKTGEFDVHYEINSLGLREDEMSSPAKPDGTFRVVVLGDSFVLGYTVDREDLFVDQLEGWWQAEGRKVDVVNAGTEGWSTDQEVLWFLQNGADFDPDLVLILPYENDLFWGSQQSYLRYPKPRFDLSGTPEARKLEDPGPKPAVDSLATVRFGKLLAGIGLPPRFQPEGGSRKIPKEYAAFLHDKPDFMDEAEKRTQGALKALRDKCAELGAGLYMVPIPNKGVVHEDARAKLARAVGVGDDAWSVERPVETFLSLAQTLGIPSFDPRDFLKQRAKDGERLYYENDWHLNPAGNRAFATFLHDRLDEAGAFPEAFAATKQAELQVAEKGFEMPFWPKLYVALLILLTILYKATYPKENLALIPLKVGLLLAAVFTIALSVKALLGILPPFAGTAVLLLLLVILGTFIAYKIGRRMGTIAELYLAFVRRGHWYLMPLVVVLLTVGSLLVVAASSPLVAPFIYTLF